MDQPTNIQPSGSQSTSGIQNSRSQPSGSQHPKKAQDGLHKALDIVGKVCKIVLPMGISAVLVIWLFHKVNIQEIKTVLHNGVRFEFIAMMMFFTMLSYIIRGIRWGIQLRAAGVPRMSPVAESVSIFGAYALNLLVQYLGEAWRCIYVARKEKVKIATIVGTDLGDRGSDLVMILLILLLTLCVASQQIHHFFDQYSLGRFLEHLFDNWWLYAIIIVVFGGFILADREWDKTKFFSGFNLSCRRMWDGFKVLFFMKGRWNYLWLTIGIWVCYFLDTYLCFFAFPFTRELIATPGSAYGLVPGLVVFIFGSMSMAVPSNGGLGPWNVAVMYALMLYGVSSANAAAYSLVVWGFQAIMIIALGIFSAIYVMLSNDKAKKRAQELQKQST
ncbi:MAG: flippase-like domain-containing protein [Muribaculaceae bacterium]|nr:flippase-like domain-containing protein [Muribaculaceae bacterium]